MPDIKVGASETPNDDQGEEKDVQAWLATIEKTVKWRDRIGDNLHWKRFIKEYKGNWDFLQTSVSIPIIPLNLPYAYVKTEIARMYFKDPWITVNPKRVEDIGSAQIAEQIINYMWGELKLKHEIKRTLLEALLIGHAWMKFGYVAEFGTVESRQKEEPRKPGRPPKEYKVVETNEYVKSENIFAYHVPYKDIIFDPSATYPATHNARWMAHKVVKPYRAVVESGIYEHTDDLKSNFIIDDPNLAYDTQESLKSDFGKDVRSVVLWEIYDLDHQAIVTVSPGCKYKLREIPYPEYLNNGFPFVQLGFNPVPGEVYPMSDVAPHEGLAVEITKIVAMEMNHLKRWNRQIIVDNDLLTDDEVAKFKDAIDGAVIKAQTNGAKDKIFVPPYAPVQSDVYQVYPQLLEAWRFIAGQTQADQGGNPRVQTRTLGELRMQLQGGKARSDEKVDVLEDFIEELARKLLVIIQKKFDLPKISRIVGPKTVQEKILKILPNRPSAQPMIPQKPGAQAGMAPQPNPMAQKSFQSDFSFTWNKQDIMGEMDVDVLAGSTVPMDRESQLQILEKTVPLLSIAGVTPGSPAAKSYLREFFRLVGIMSLESIMDLVDQQPPQPPPKIMETQAKIQGKMMETKMKVQAKQQEEAIKLKALQEKAALDKQKKQQDLQHSVVKSILQTLRTPQNPTVNGGGL